jgi:alcohol dehydrogenase class IV
MADEVRWRDADRGRSVLMRPGLIAELPAALDAEGWGDFELLSTERALAGALGLSEAAKATHLVPEGPVPETAAAVIGEVGSDRLVALGGGRVIDTAKAIAAVRGGEVAAIPTTLSGAEMTAIHRLPAGREGVAGVRPALVLADPGVMASAPEGPLRASAMNALAHGADSLYTPLADDLSRGSALRGAALIASALDSDRAGRSAPDLALGSLLSANALDLAGLALHHVLSQTSVRVLETPHAETNAAVLPVAMEEMAARAPEQIAALAGELGTEGGGEEIRRRIEQLAGGRRSLGELGADRALIPDVVAGALARGELSAMTPGPDFEAADVERLIGAAW